MLDYSNVITNSKAFKIIELDATSSRLSHAYMFVAEDENYLKSFCEKVCKYFINLNETKNAQKNEIRIDSRNHPDVKFYGEKEKSADKERIMVDDVAEIVEQASYTPFEADKKIFVLWHADNMNESAQNKILKTIEEPPKNTYFILAAASTSKLLQTILSRVKTIELDTLSTDTICEMLEQTGVSKDKALVYAACSNGNGAFAEKLAKQTGFVEFFGQVVSCFFEINGSRDVLKFSNIFGAKTVDKEEFLDIAMVVCRDIQMILAGKDEFVVNKNYMPKLKVISSTLNFGATSTLIETIIAEKKKLHYNINSTAVLDDFLFKLAEVKVKCRRL